MSKSTYLLGISASVALTFLSYVFFSENNYITFGIFSFMNGAIDGILIITFFRDMLLNALMEEKEEFETKILKD